VFYKVFSKKPGPAWLIVSLLVLATLILLPGVAYSHAGFERSNPSPNASLPSGKPPSQVTIWFTERVELRFSEIQVLDSRGTRLDADDLRNLSGDPKALAVSLNNNLPDGIYTVQYRNVSAEDGHTTRGSFAFVVGVSELPFGAGLPSPLDIALSSNLNALENLNFWGVTLRWLNYLAGTLLLGALLYALLVWRVSIRLVRNGGRMGPQLPDANAAGLLIIRRIVWIGLAGLLIGWIGWFLYQTATFSGQSLFQVLGIGTTAGQPGTTALTDFLFASRYGAIWLVRLGILLIALFYWLIFLRLSSKEGGSAKALIEDKPLPWWVMAGLSAGILLTASLNSHSAGVSSLSLVSILADWLHLLSIAAWGGGLVAIVCSLAGAIPRLLPATGDRTRLLAAIIPFFSQLALFSVTVLVFTGFLNAIFQLNEPSELFTTPYGLSLTAKLALLIPLLILGAYNLLVVKPRMKALARSKKAGPKEGAGSLEAGKLGQNFRRVIFVEVGLVIMALLAASLLTSSTPPKDTGNEGVKYFQIQQGGIKLELAISPGVIGENVFEARLQDESGKLISSESLVEVLFDHRGMDMGIQRLPLKPLKERPGRYIAIGSNLSMTGVWIATLLIQRSGYEDIRVPFTMQLK
jgi:copper transport protein